MSNNFPSVPTDFEMASILYTANFPSVIPATIGGAVVNMQGNLSNLGGSGALQLVFSTPGSFGTFDQTAAETGIRTVVTDICQLMADLQQKTLATVQAEVTIDRGWTWTDTSGNTATYTDTMVYP